MEVHKTIGHHHSHHGNTKHSSTLCCSIPKIWMAIQKIIATDNRKAWQALSQDSDRIAHVKNALVMSRMPNDASLLPASGKHRVLQFEQPRRVEAQVRFGRVATDLNALQIAMFYGNEVLACQIVSFLRLHADHRELTSFLNHVWGNNNTSLHLASFLAMSRLVKLLMELGASPTTLNGRKLTPAECCKDPECLARLGLSSPQPMVPTAIAKKRVSVVAVSTERLPSNGITKSSSNKIKRDSLASPTMTAARQTKPPPAQSPAVTAPASPAPVVLEKPPQAPHTATAAAGVTLPQEAPLVVVVQDQRESSLPAATESSASLKQPTHSPSVIAYHDPEPKKMVVRYEKLSSMSSSVTSLPLPPPRLHGPGTDSGPSDPSYGLDPTSTVQSRLQLQQHCTLPTLYTGGIPGTEAASKHAIVLSVKDPSDSVLFHVAAFYVRQVVKALDSHQQNHHPKEGMLQTSCYDSMATVETLAVAHVYREQEAPIL